MTNLEGKRKRNNPCIFGGKLRETTRITVKVVGVPANIRTEQLLNASLMLYTLFTVGWEHLDEFHVGNC
jgi:hypothetical protein